MINHAAGLSAFGGRAAPGPLGREQALERLRLGVRRMKPQGRGVMRCGGRGNEDKRQKERNGEDPPGDKTREKGGVIGCDGRCGGELKRRFRGSNPGRGLHSTSSRAKA